MSEEKVLIDTLSQSAFKHSADDKNRTVTLATENAEETRKQFGIDPSPITSHNKDENKESLATQVEGMSAQQGTQLISSLKQAGLSDPLTPDSIVQNAFTVEKAIRDAGSN